MPDRRSLLTLAAGALAFAPGAVLAQGAAPATPPPPALAADDPRMTERSLGRADAPVTVIEYFSLTCGHCAAFHRETWPKVKSDLVQAGRMRMVFRDFPLDGLALAAAAVARSLPAERYEPFISTLLSSQDRWAFARGGDPREELFKVAALAGMPRAKYDEVLADQALARAILAARVAGQQEHNVSSTPTFVFGSRAVPGNMTFTRFAQLVGETR
ncbi:MULTISPECIES: thioredoxin domain-containing protein [Roseomonadaceae]|uniref:Thioredoxin domain-containing protein n=1 Tax=Falsiroseomonas oleicola TaxID=2801474 RepID=A0ABS6H4W3_9PROT|nr:thioredoxin domain-containing protein [Roseomonas oleicola]MBU8543727.1 thioredoxin domain-containing protein [Roseomonas oleicola]